MMVYIVNILIIIIQLVPFVLPKQDSFTVTQDRIDPFYLNTEYMVGNGTMRFIDRKTKGLQVHLENLESWTDYVVTVYANKWINGAYVKYSAIQFVEPMKKILAYEWFDLQALFLKYTTPPLVYPVKPAKYHMNDWVPDSQKFPPYIPSGKYMVQIILHREKAKKTKVCEYQWHLTIAPIAKW